jgi:hypothetical protein
MASLSAIKHVVFGQDCRPRRQRVTGRDGVETASRQGRDRVERCLGDVPRPSHICPHLAAGDSRDLQLMAVAK